MTTLTTPNRPKPESVTVSGSNTAIAVLDLSKRCEDAKEPCHQLLQRLAPFLERARSAEIPIVFTVSLMLKGTPGDAVASPLARKENGPIVHPDSFDKFSGGELKEILVQHNVKNLILVGSATNIAVMYTATAAARTHRYQVVLPVDGTAARSDYEQEYALHQLSTLPQAVVVPIHFATLEQIKFQ